ncbi:helix-turn-helix domain-containing protein, partial [Patulibacter sp. S7RM1-6]
MEIGVGPAAPTEVGLGLPALDAVLGGLFRGENVLWTVDGDDAEPFAEALVRSMAGVPGYGRRVLLGGDAGSAPPGVAVVADADAATEAVRGSTAERPGLLVVVGADGASSDATDRELPALARAVVLHGAVACWIAAAPVAQGAAWSRVADLAGGLVEVRDGRLRLARADGRGAEAHGAMFAYRVEDGALRTTGTSAAALLGRGLRAVRRQRGWSQSDLARLAGVSASAISQAERGQHALSLETVLELSARLGVTLDELVRGREPAYVVARGERTAAGAGRPAGALLPA